MKRSLAILSFVFLSLLVFASVTPPIAKAVIKKNLENVFVSSRVNLGHVALKPWHSLVINDIYIAKETVYSLKIKNLQIRLFPAILRGLISSIKINGVLLDLNQPDKNINAVAHLLKVSNNKLLSLGLLEAFGLSFHINSRDLSLQGKVSLQADLKRQVISSVTMNIEYVDFAGFHINSIDLDIKSDLHEGSFNVKEVRHDKFTIKDFKAAAVIKDRLMDIGPFYADIFGTRASGKINLFLEQDLRYFLSFKAEKVVIERIISDFSLGDKFLMDGLLSAEGVLEGRQSRIKELRINIETIEPGGMLTIKDDKLLDSLANGSNEPMEIIMESFKDYRYNSGKMRLFSEGRDLVLSAVLQGAGGSRNLDIVFHDFRLGGLSL